MATRRDDDWKTVPESAWDFVWKVATIPYRVVKTGWEVVWPTVKDDGKKDKN